MEREIGRAPSRMPATDEGQQKVHMKFDPAIRYSREQIANAEINSCGVPHIVVDDALSPALLAAINDHWPSESSFEPEIPGNYICTIRRRRYLGLDPASRFFWIRFNELFWPSLVASCGERLIGPLNEVFGRLIFDKFRYAKTLTLMEADPSFSQHGQHTHFYHNPNWAFTILLYVDPDDRTSAGTTLHNSMPALSDHPGQPTHQSNYTSGSLQERVASALQALNPDALPIARDVSYKAGRLLVMCDGPLSFHSVQRMSSTPAGGPPNEPQRRIRRILRTHTCVRERQFYKSMAGKIGYKFSSRNFQLEFSASRESTDSNAGGKASPMRRFIEERLNSYEEMAQKIAFPHARQRREIPSNAYELLLRELRLHHW